MFIHSLVFVSKWVLLVLFGGANLTYVKRRLPPARSRFHIEAMTTLLPWILCEVSDLRVGHLAF